MIKSKVFHFEDLEYFRFSVYRMGKNVQTVYTFLLGDTLIDTGQRNSREEVVARLDNKGISKILLTHYHEDHSGNAAFLKKRWHVPVYGHPETVRILKKGYTISPLSYMLSGNVEQLKMETLQENEVFHAGDYLVEPIHTPGHSQDHYAYYVRSKGWLFTGDLYVAEKIKYFANFESMKQQIESLHKLCTLDFDVLMCSHNPKTSNGKHLLERKLQHFEDFYGMVKQLHDKGMSPKEILEYTGRKENVFYDWITLGNFNALNMVKSVLRDEGVLK